MSLLSRVPVVSAVLGTAAGGPAGRAILSHWSVMVKRTAQVFAAGPPVVERALGHKFTKEELGGCPVAVDAAGTIDNAVGERSGVLRRGEAIPLLSCRTTCGSFRRSSRRTTRRTGARRRCASIVPRNRRQPYNMRKLVELVVDRGSAFEIQPTFGKAVITALARMNGKAVGVIANNPDGQRRGGRRQGGAQADPLRRALRHVPHPDGVPGRCSGVHGRAGGRDRRDAARRHALRLYARQPSTVPMVTVIIRKCYGMAGMATTQQERSEPEDRLAVGRVGLAADRGRRRGGVPAGDRASTRPRQRGAGRSRTSCRALASPFRTAEAFGIEDIIDPRETRGYLCRFIDAVQPGLRTDLGPKARVGVRP